MRNHKSHTELLLGIYEVLITQDMVRQYDDRSFLRDFNRIRRRTESEGLSFLTKTLPSFAKAIDNALVTGRLTCIEAFKKGKDTAYPLFLSGLLSRVFEKDGLVKTDPCISAVKDLRQILYLLYKYEINHKEEVNEAVVKDFIKVDQELSQAAWRRSSSSDDSSAMGINSRLASILSVARTLLYELFLDVDVSNIKPAHGPGSVATGELNWEKMDFKRIYDGLQSVYPDFLFNYSNAMDLASQVKERRLKTRLPYGFAKIVLVPKDSRGPRLISMEPLEYQWIQQGIKRILYPHIENHYLTKGHVNFESQKVNQDLAKRGSMSGDIVTLDMKEASDRISTELVFELLKDTNLWKYLHASRTVGTTVLSGEQILLNKFAPMGSALCFPVMSIVHWSLAVATLNVCSNLRLEKAREAVYVYGDDIIIKGENHMPLYDVFEGFGLKFNASKCCTTGIFRESCGMNAVLGQDVTVVKIKKLLPMPKPGKKKSYDAAKYVAYLDYCNSLWNSAYYSTSLYIGDYLEYVYSQAIPNVSEDANVPGFCCPRTPPVSNANKFKKRINKRYQKEEFRVLTVGPKKHYRPMDRSEYQRKLLINGEEFLAGVYSVPRRVKLKLGWSGDLLVTRGTNIYR